MKGAETTDSALDLRKSEFEHPSGKYLLKDEKLARLSPQEERILSLVADCKTNREIGDELNLAEKTVKNYVSRILSKLGRPPGRGRRLPGPAHHHPPARGAEVAPARARRRVARPALACDGAQEQIVDQASAPEEFDVGDHRSAGQPE